MSVGDKSGTRDKRLTLQSVARLASFLRRGIVNRGDVDELFDGLTKIFDLSGLMLVDGFEGGSFVTQGVPDPGCAHTIGLRTKTPRARC